MTMAFLLTTLLLASAWFAAVNVTSSLGAWLAAAALRGARFRPRAAVLLAIRFFPAAASLLVIGLFVPTHWAAEARDVKESFGIVVYALAAGGALLMARSVVRALALARADRRLRARECASPVIVGATEVDGVPGLALAGLFRTRILIGRRVAQALTAAELDVALAHEDAHRRAIDNVKRWAFHCAPDVLGGSAAARHVEREWHRAAESLADARAARGDAQRALHLASALLKVARLTMPDRFDATIVCSPFNDPVLLKQRIEQLMSAAPDAAPPRRGYVLGVVIGVLASAGLLLPLLAGPLHSITELAVALLP
jgi:beta-lactamase regulating signal transducer with metallopeptidase domain